MRRSDVNRHAAAFKGFPQHPANLRIHAAQQMITSLDDGDLTPNAAQEMRHFQSDGTAAQHDK
jgi:hypothetical protein